jgi:preprotein translocase subunit SecF
MRLFANANYDFIGNRVRALILLGLLLVPGLVLLLLRGLDYSIEFTGGTLIQIETRQPVDVAQLRAALNTQGIAGAEIQQFGSDREFVIRALTAKEGTDADDTQATSQAVAAALDASVGAGTYTVLRTEAVGPKVGGELRTQAVWLVLFSFVAVLLYLAFRFEWRFGVAAVVATMHDIISAIAFVALLRIEVSLFVVGALLSIVGYSLNDKIVVLDRVREDLRKHHRSDFTGLLNRAINETLPRTVFTGTTALGSLVALATLGGEVVRGFALVMLYGVVIGTISSMFVAAPVLLWIEQRWPGAAVKQLRVPVRPNPPAGSTSGSTGGRKAQPVG